MWELEIGTQKPLAVCRDCDLRINAVTFTSLLVGEVAARSVAGEGALQAAPGAPASLSPQPPIKGEGLKLELLEAKVGQPFRLIRFRPLPR
jgi:hypothetical protein